MTCASDKYDKDVDGDAQVVGVSGGSSCLSTSEGIVCHLPLLGRRDGAAIQRGHPKIPEVLRG